MNTTNTLWYSSTYMIQKKHYNGWFGFFAAGCQSTDMLIVGVSNVHANGPNRWRCITWPAEQGGTLVDYGNQWPSVTDTHDGSMMPCKSLENQSIFVNRTDELFPLDSRYAHVCVCLPRIKTKRKQLEITSQGSNSAKCLNNFAFHFSIINIGLSWRRNLLSRIRRRPSKDFIAFPFLSGFLKTCTCCMLGHHVCIWRPKQRECGLLCLCVILIIRIT